MKKLSICFVLTILLGAFPAWAALTQDQLDKYLAATDATQMGQKGRDILSQNLLPDDVINYLAFISTVHGKHYVEFNQRIDPLLSDSIRSLRAGQILSANPTAMNEQQYKQDKEMLLQSTTFQVLQRQQFSPGIDSSSFSQVILDAALKKHPEDLNKIYKDYSGDIEAFRTYNESQTAMNISNAELKVEQQKRIDAAAGSSGKN